MKTLFLCAGCGELFEFEDYQVDQLHAFEALLRRPLVVHCFNCALETTR